MRLIDADALIESMKTYHQHIKIIRNPRATKRNGSEDAVALDMMGMVKLAPTIIVLCKECVYYMPRNQQLKCAFHSTYVDEDAYCSYGERRE